MIFGHPIWLFLVSLWTIPYLIIDLNFFLTKKLSPVSNSLVILPLLHISLCLSLLSDNRMLKISLFLNRSGYASSKKFNDCCLSEVPSLDLYDDRSVENGNSLLIATTDKVMSVTYTGPEFQAYITNNTDCNHWWRMTLSTEFIFCKLFKYQHNP